MAPASKNDLFRADPALLEPSDFTLAEGGTLRIRALKPSERADLRGRPEGERMIRALKTGIVEPALSMDEARDFLDFNPFEALRVYRAIRARSAGYDSERLSARFDSENRKFLRTLEKIGELAR